MERKYRTVNGIKVKLVDEKTRKIIERAGDIEAQVKAADRLGVLDRDFYNKLLRGLRSDRFLKSVVTLGLYFSYGLLYYELGLLAICTIFPL